MTNAMKKGLCALAIALTLLPLGMIAHAGDMPTVPLTPTRIAGDANGDGTVDLKDAAALARHLAGGWNITINDKNADVNADNSVDLKDVVLIRRYLAGGWRVTLV